MSRYKVKNKGRFAVFIIVVVLILAALVFGIGFVAKRLKAQTKPLGDDDYNTTGSAISDGPSTGSSISAGEPTLTPEEQEKLNRELARAKEVSDAQAKINSATYPINTVEDFNLILTNKTHGLSNTYKPEDLVTIDRHVEGVGNTSTHKLRQVAANALNKMLDAVALEGLEIRMRTGFRSFDYQSSLYNSYVDKDGKKAADTYSARPGYSEHQTGLACDLGGKTEGFALSYKFGDTPEGQWVAKHAHEYGFIIRFTDGTTDEKGKRQPGEITGYVFEPWHVRYVGLDHAQQIHEKGITLEEYLGIVDDAQYKN